MLRHCATECLKGRKTNKNEATRNIRMARVWQKMIELIYRQEVFLCRTRESWTLNFQFSSFTHTVTESIKMSWATDFVRHKLAFSVSRKCAYKQLSTFALNPISEPNYVDKSSFEIFLKIRTLTRSIFHQNRRYPKYSDENTTVTAANIKSVQIACDYGCFIYGNLIWLWSNSRPKCKAVKHFHTVIRQAGREKKRERLRACVCV